MQSKLDLKLVAVNVHYIVFNFKQIQFNCTVSKIGKYHKNTNTITLYIQTLYRVSSHLALFVTVLIKKKCQKIIVSKNYCVKKLTYRFKLDIILI